MIFEKYPNWDIDVEKGTIYSLSHKKFIGSKNRNGYLVIRNPYGKCNILLHRVIWECINGDIPNGYDIHHIDHNPLNNSIYNLELLSKSEHESLHHKSKQYHLGKHHSEETKLKMSESHKDKKRSEETKLKCKYNQPKIKQVAQYTLDGELIKIWDSINDCRKNGFNQAHVISCCQCKRKTHKGYIWKYYNEERV